MKSRTEIIGNRIVNSVEQLACYLNPGDIFRKPLGKTKYKFGALLLDEHVVTCLNMDTMVEERIYYNAPVFKLVPI